MSFRKILFSLDKMETDMLGFTYLFFLFFLNTQVLVLQIAGQLPHDHERAKMRQGSTIKRVGGKKAPAMQKEFLKKFLDPLRESAATVVQKLCKAERIKKKFSLLNQYIRFSYFKYRSYCIHTHIYIFLSLHIFICTHIFYID